MSGKEMLHQRYRPLLQSLRKHSVVGVSKRLTNNVPGLVPLQTLQIHKYTLQFGDGKRRVGVVQLNSDLVRELLP